MALTVPQIEQHAGRLLRQFLTHIEPEVAAKFLSPFATALLNGGKRYVLNGTIGTQAERLEAIMTIAKALYQQVEGVNPDDGTRGQHGFEAHWFPAKQRGE